MIELALAAPIIMVVVLAGLSLGVKYYINWKYPRV